VCVNYYPRLLRCNVSYIELNAQLLDRDSDAGTCATMPVLDWGNFDGCAIKSHQGTSDARDFYVTAGRL